MFGIWRSRTTEESSLTVGRGPVPRHAPVSKNVRGGQAPALRSCAGDRPPRYGMGRFSLRGGRGPVPRLGPPETANRIGFAHKFLAIRTELWDNYAYVNQYCVKNDAPEPN